LSRLKNSSQGGQILVLFTMSVVVLLLGAGLVVDGGFAFNQRRISQNAADFAAMAGTRIIGEWRTGVPAGAGTAANVQAAITATLNANQADLETAKYIDTSGNSLGNVVGATSIPSNAWGVVVGAKATWRPFFLGIVGMDHWTASSTATAFTPGASVGGGVLPIGLQDTVFDNLAQCPIDNLTPCVQSLTHGVQNIPGGFGWLAFGVDGNGNKCDWISLGMVADGGCQRNQNFLDSQIGPPSDSHGCCTAVGLPGSSDRIGSLPGNEWGDLSFYINNQIPVWVPIWDTADAGGANGFYHIVGFGAIVFAGEGTQHAKWLTGAAIGGAGCPGAGNALVPGHDYCMAPGGAFTIGVTGDVRLVH
jgi:Putative Flp pilus-assembly TadE/G-like